MPQDGRAVPMGGGTPPSPTPIPENSLVRGRCGSTNPISLAIPRPENERSINLYVDTPFQHKVCPRREEVTLPQAPRPHDFPSVHGAGSHRSSLHRPHQGRKGATPPETSSFQKHQEGVASIGSESICAQPTTLTFTKRTALGEDSIICGRCGRCRCQACRTPRSPSSKWLCGGKCHISLSAFVDYVSCLCCVRGILYHCAKEDDEEPPAVDRPCSCAGNDAGLRWACLALSTVPLPCLLCYWPLTAFRTLCEKTYQRFTTQGCRCDPASTMECRSHPIASSATPEKPLLRDSR